MTRRDRLEAKYQSEINREPQRPAATGRRSEPADATPAPDAPNPAPTPRPRAPRSVRKGKAGPANDTSDRGLKIEPEPSASDQPAQDEGAGRAGDEAMSERQRRIAQRGETEVSYNLPVTALNAITQMQIEALQAGRSRPERKAIITAALAKLPDDDRAVYALVRQHADARDHCRKVPLTLPNKLVVRLLLLDARHRLLGSGAEATNVDMTSIVIAALAQHLPWTPTPPAPRDASA